MPRRDCYAPCRFWPLDDDGKEFAIRHGTGEAQMTFLLSDLSRDSLLIRRWVEKVHAYEGGCSGGPAKVEELYVYDPRLKAALRGVS